MSHIAITLIAITLFAVVLQLTRATNEVSSGLAEDPAPISKQLEEDLPFFERTKRNPKFVRRQQKKGRPHCACAAAGGWCIKQHHKCPSNTIRVAGACFCSHGYIFDCCKPVRIALDICKDTTDICKENVKNCHHNFIRKRCMKTCGQCGKCEDSWLTCHLNIKNCHFYSIKKVCKKACGLCGPTDICTIKCMNGVCTNNNKCVCKEGWSGPGCDIKKCEDSWLICHLNIKNCHLESIQKVCKKTCGLCGPTDICTIKCMNGVCTNNNKCVCKEGWSGPGCDISVCTIKCVNGVCSKNNKCLCHDGWSGPSCDIITGGCQCGIANTPSKQTSQKGTVSGLRIVGGTDAMKHKYPWLVRILMRISSYQSSLCGGSLVNERYVLTAGHCTYKKGCYNPYEAKDMEITVAEHNVHSIYDDVRATKKYKASEIIRHESYCLKSNTNKFNHDIALLKLSEAVDLSAREAGIICLPPHSEAVYENELAMVAGWGITSELGSNGGSMATNLQEVNITTNNCNAYPDASHINENMICAGDMANTMDACAGDSGGPLIARSPGSNKYVQIGVVSFGPPGGKCTGIGVYTKVVNYIDWIKLKTQDAECQNNIAPRNHH